MPRALARCDDCHQVLLHLGDRQPAQSVVGAERQHEYPHIAFKRPVEPSEPTGGGIAGYTGIDDIEGVALGIDFLL